MASRQCLPGAAEDEGVEKATKGTTNQGANLGENNNILLDVTRNMSIRLD